MLKHTFPTEGKPTNPTDATPVLIDHRLDHNIWFRYMQVPRDIETKSTTTATTAAGTANELTPELCDLGLELTQMVARGLILLG